MDHAVRRGDVGGDDLRVIDFHALGRIDREFPALHGLDHLALTRDVAGHDLAGNHVIGQHGHELFLVLGLQQVFHGALRQFGEGGVGRRKNREGAITLQRVDQTGGLHRGDQGVEFTGRNGGVYDVRGLGRDCAEQHRCSRNGDDEKTTNFIHDVPPQGV